jgi:hypothetical protein
MADDTEIEIVDAEVVDLEPRSSAQLAQATATQAALVAAGGIAAGVATVAVFKRHRSGRAARRSRKALGDVVASRRFLVDVHLLRN